MLKSKIVNGKGKFSRYNIIKSKIKNVLKKRIGNSNRDINQNNKN